MSEHESDRSSETLGRTARVSSYQSAALRSGHSIPPAKSTRRAGILHPTVAIVARLAGHDGAVGGIIGAPIARFSRIGPGKKTIKPWKNEGGFKAAARTVDGGVAALELRAARRCLQTIVTCRVYTEKCFDLSISATIVAIFSYCLSGLPRSHEPMHSASIVPSLSVKVPLLQGYLRPSPGQ